MRLQFALKNWLFKNNAPFVNCISKINGVLIDKVEDLDVVMPIYSLLEYSKNYKKIVCGVITEINQILVQKDTQTLLLKTQSHSIINQVLQEVQKLLI